MNTLRELLRVPFIVDISSITALLTKALLTKALLTNALLTTALSVAVMASTAQAQEFDTKTLTLTGWPFDPALPVWQLAEDDPMFSSLVCPALTRLNLAKNISEPQLASSIKAEGKRWTITLSPTAKLWQGQQLTGKAVAAFLSRQLAPHIKRMFAGQISVPDARYTSTHKQRAIIDWQRKPSFGPYVLSGLPVYIAGSTNTSSGKLQCAGAYQPTVAAKNRDKSMTLTLAPSQKNRGKFTTIVLRSSPSTKSKIDKKAKSRHSMTFSFADSFDGNPWRRLSDQKISCKRTMPTSVMTAIMWNPDGRYTKERSFRGAMTHLTPRGALLRSGGGNLGKLVSAPIPRHHPGYHRRVFVRSFSYPKAVKILESLGYKRPVHDKPRLLPDGKTPLSLTIGTLSPEGPMHKILADSYRSVGINLKFKRIKNPNVIPTQQKASLDGILMGLKLPYPSGNVLPLLTAESPFGGGYDSLSQQFVPYLQSLTQKRPDFSKLRAAHVALYREEPLSVLLQYSQCVSVSSKKIVLRSSPNVKDPSWLKKLIF